jgi:hypothetical protein
MGAHERSLGIGLGLFVTAWAAACGDTSNDGPGGSGTETGGSATSASGGDAAPGAGAAVGNAGDSNSGGPAGGTNGVGASGGDATGPAPDIWDYDGDYKDPSLPDTVRDDFEGDIAASGAPTIVYPLDDAMHATNVGRIAFHWTPGNAASEVFRITVDDEGTPRSFFVPCGPPPEEEGCVYDMPEANWFDFATRNAGRDSTATIAEPSGDQVAVSAELKLHFSPEPVLGVVYFLAGSGSVVERAEMGGSPAVPFMTPESTSNGYECNSCHSVSRDGSTFAAVVSQGHGENVAGIRVVHAEDPTQAYVSPTPGTSPWGTVIANVASGGTLEGQPTDHFGHLAALSPDGERSVVNGLSEFSAWPPYLELRQAKTDTALHRYGMDDAIFGGDGLGIHPEWSPDGQDVVVAISKGIECTWTNRTCRGDIAVIPYAGEELGTAQTLVEGTDEPSNNTYYYNPTWSPDGKYVAFMAANSGDSLASSLSNFNGMIFMVPSTGGPYTCPSADCYELNRGVTYDWATIQAEEGLHASWPKFLPFAQGENDSLYFLSMVSSRDYGLLSELVSGLWIFAVDTQGLTPGADPSYPPVWFSSQTAGESAIMPSWAERIP